MREIINIVSFNSPTGATSFALFSFPPYLSLTNTIFSHFPTYPFTFRELRGEERGTLELFGLYHGVLANLFTEIRIAQVKNKNSFICKKAIFLDTNFVYHLKKKTFTSYQRKFFILRLWSNFFI